LPRARRSASARRLISAQVPAEPAPALSAGSVEPTPAVSLTVVGSVNLDLVARVEHLPVPGETVSASSLARLPGGKGANQAVAAARAGAQVRFVGAVGDDAFAAE